MFQAQDEESPLKPEKKTKILSSLAFSLETQKGRSREVDELSDNIDA